jgi:hypothetical protein
MTLTRESHQIRNAATALLMVCHWWCDGSSSSSITTTTTTVVVVVVTMMIMMIIRIFQYAYSIGNTRPIPSKAYNISNVKNMKVAKLGDDDDDEPVADDDDDGPSLSSCRTSRIRPATIMAAMTGRKHEQVGGGIEPQQEILHVCRARLNTPPIGIDGPNACRATTSM